jgi:hypothetical protein
VPLIIDFPREIIISYSVLLLMLNELLAFPPNQSSLNAFEIIKPLHASIVAKLTVLREPNIPCDVDIFNGVILHLNCVVVVFALNNVSMYYVPVLSKYSISAS